MDELSALTRLQEIDLELLRSAKAVEELPQKDRISRLRRAIKQANSELARAHGRRKDLEMDLEENEHAQLEASEAVDEAQKAAEESDQGYRAIKDLEAKLTMLAKRLEKLAFDQVKIKEDLDAAIEDEKTKQSWIERAAAEEESQLMSYKRELSGYKGRIEELRREREELVGEIDETTLSRYEAAYKRFKGLAVEALDGNKPSVCRVALQPGQMAQLKQGSVQECPYCHRLLVIPA